MWKKLKVEDGSNSMDRISELPKEILQRILYFLSQEESVRTSVLSKSCRYIWCTRPNLDFSDNIFKSTKQDFVSVVNNTLQRYCDQRLSLEEFRICISDHESVFEAESLRFLHLNQSNLSQKSDKIAFERLQVLHLRNVNFIEEETFDKITSSCPLLNTMLFVECKGLKTIKHFTFTIKHFTFTKYKFYTRYECSIEIDVPSLETIDICGGKIHFHGHKFSNLKSMTLTRAEISTEQSQLCIDAPNVLYFEYSGFCMPSICSTPTLRKSRLQHFIHANVVDAQSWFLTLSKLLQALRQSEIHLNIVQLSTNNVHVEEDILIQDIINGGIKPVVVEHFRLNIVHLSSVSYVLNGLFCICRPRKITTRWYTQGQWNKDSKKTELIEFICKVQMMSESGNRKIWKDLEDLRIERFDKSRGEWKPLQGTGMLLESALADFDRVRVRLEWSGQAVRVLDKSILHYI